MAVGCTSTPSAKRLRSLEVGSGRWRPTNTNPPEYRAGLRCGPFDPRRERSAGGARGFRRVHSRLTNWGAPHNGGLRRKLRLLGRRDGKLARGTGGFPADRRVSGGRCPPTGLPRLGPQPKRGRARRDRMRESGEGRRLGLRPSRGRSTEGSASGYQPPVRNLVGRQCGW